VLVTSPTVHAVFSPSAAGSLSVSLRNAGRPDRVACQFDNLALGPINPSDHGERLAWMQHELHWAGLEDVLPAPEAFWDEALREDIRKVPEYCAFLEWLGAAAARPAEADRGGHPGGAGAALAQIALTTGGGAMPLRNRRDRKAL
jgi:Domain of unknown function (DUF1835)